MRGYVWSLKRFKPCLKIKSWCSFPVIEQRAGISHTNLEFLAIRKDQARILREAFMAMDARESADMADDEESGFLSRVELGALGDELSLATGHLARMARHNEGKRRERWKKSLDVSRDVSYDYLCVGTRPALKT